jgi:hypothetical protein
LGHEIAIGTRHVIYNGKDRQPTPDGRRSWIFILIVALARAAKFWVTECAARPEVDALHVLSQ